MGMVKQGKRSIHLSTYGLLSVAWFGKGGIGEEVLALMRKFSFSLFFNL